MTPEEKRAKRDAALRSLRSNASYQEILRRLAEYDTGEDTPMALTPGAPAEQPPMQSQDNPALKINADAPQPSSVENTYTPQAQADAAAIDRAYGK